VDLVEDVFPEWTGLGDDPDARFGCRDALSLLKRLRRRTVQGGDIVDWITRESRAGRDRRPEQLAPVVVEEGIEASYIDPLALTATSRGKSSSDIGAIVGLSPRTVDSYLEKACAKLRVRTRIEAVVKAVRDGLIDP